MLRQPVENQVAALDDVSIGRIKEAWEHFNHILALSALNNTYIAVRHGQSEANVAGEIVSTPERGVAAFGLTEKGREQAEAAGAKLGHLNPDDVVIISSDFLRARQTAEIIGQCLGIGADRVEFSPNLRERFFGDLDGTAAKNYVPIGEADSADPFHKLSNVESVIEILSRTSELILSLEERFKGKTIIMVSHGDTIQVMETAFKKVSPAEHRNRPHVKNCEIVAMVLPHKSQAD